MAEMKPASIAGTAVINIGGVEVTKEFSISAPSFMVFEKQTGAFKVSVDADEFKRKSGLITDWLKTFPSELENG